MKRERTEVITELVSLFDGDTREEVTKIIEDVSDSWGESETNESGITQEMYDEMKGNYENSVKKYRDRFTQGTEKKEETEETEETEEKTKEYDDLFEEEKEN